MLLKLTSTVPGLKPSRRPIVECLLTTSALQCAGKVWILKEDAGFGRGGGCALVSFTPVFTEQGQTLPGRRSVLRKHSESEHCFLK